MRTLSHTNDAQASFREPSLTRWPDQKEQSTSHSSVILFFGWVLLTHNAHFYVRTHAHRLDQGMEWDGAYDKLPTVKKYAASA